MIRAPAPAVPFADPLEQVTPPVLRTAADRVLLVLREEAPEAWGETNLPADLASLAQALSPEAPEPPSDFAYRFGNSVGRHLLGMLRAEVLRVWREADPAPNSEEMLPLLDAFERIGRAIEPKWDSGFASQLTGPNGLERLMEIAHDLRSPLTSILFLAETLRRGQSGEVNEIQHRQLGIVYSAALGLTAVVSDVIELARGGSRLLEKEPSPLSVSEILESVRDIVRPMAEEKGLTVRLLPLAQDQRLGYPVALSRVLLNLTTNALKFTDEGFVEIVARAKSPTRVEFSVRDTGNGIAREVLKTLYRPFRRSPSGDRYSFSGTGLGLSICRRLVEAMGSELQLETDPNWGTRFFFELELRPAPPL